MDNNQFIMISYEELVSLLIMCNYSNGVAGMQISEFDLPEEEQKKYVHSNQQKLIESGFIKIDDKGEINIDSDTAHLLFVLMNHQFSYIMIRMVSEYHRSDQLVYEICGPYIVEHYIFNNGMHRFLIIPSAEDLYERIRKLVPISDIRSENTDIYTIPVNTFRQTINQVQNGNIIEPMKTLTGIGMPDEIASNCISGINSPEITVSIMGIVYESQLATNITSISVFANKESLWGVWPAKEENEADDAEEKAALFECTQSDVVSVFKNWIDLLQSSEKSE